MSDNQSVQTLSYQQVAKIADNILASGKKIRIDLVRREIGFGDYAQIANYLRKWQSSSNKNNGKSHNKSPQGQNQKRIARGGRNNQGANKAGPHPRRFHQYDDETFTTVVKSSPFCMETFLQESDSVKALFLSIYMIRQKVSETVDGMRREKAKSLSYRKQADLEIRRSKMDARVEINALYSEITKILMLKEHEISSLKSQL